ncbi:LytR/AlgR family response regulator transcription factor [Clostridium tarantellae]|uniref:Stage 0 sporulation protein A homolog n=1 Tax=Clostridium tarantellae TaxID=39493 RepID=A0A6I1MNV0_9CLOT|nr:LytTR family DNA-binding domain-containing protein [Clostridium tarantellae]MPQ44148.1 response regulator [Clostridium tarantellae]
MNLRVLLIEDEPGIRILLKKIIEKKEGFTVIGECDNAKEAIKIFEKTKPDIVFLDVQINEGNGIECAKKMADINPKTKIIFATAHADYMQEAFEVYAFDYLVKPFNVDRVFNTLNRINNIENLKNNNDDLDKIIRYEKGLDKLLVKGKESISFVDIKEIILVQREDSNTVIYTKDDYFTTSATLTEIEKKLGGDEFMRSHKSYLINISQISKIFPYGRWTYVVKFKDINKDALITQEKYEEIKKIFFMN